MSRPKLLVRTARTGARLYRRERDLPGAVPGLLNKPEASILPQLIETEERCEAARRAKSPAYRPAHHVQVLSALLAEQAQVKASGSDALRCAI
ncbi:hypothetical protein KHP62_17480 [Rhodobacteraceae bacterium NNCM2]|nr:hypothetical protein [Coraliihabitans acroporae]